MKKFIATILLSLAAAVAFAMPAPTQIEAALAARDYTTAQAMTAEVLAAKPNSAKAHLFNSYILLKQGNKQAAANELQVVRQLDTNGSVAGSALFGRTVAELEAPVIVQTARPVAFMRPVHAVHRTDTTALKIALFVLVGLIIFYILYRIFREDEVVYVNTSPTYGGGISSNGTISSRGVYGGPVVAAQPTVVVHDNGLNNMATGMMLGSMMSHGHHDHFGGGYGYGGGGVIVDDGYGVDTSGYVEPAVAVDSYSDSASFSSGGGGYDSGSSSSSDSSSSWDSGGSSDFGGGGGWD